VSNRVKDLEARLERTEQQLRLLQKISRLLARDITVQQVLRSVVSLVVEFMQCDSCLVYFLEKDRLVLCAASDRDQHAVGKVSLKLDEGLTGWVARERRLLAISREAYNDPRFKYFKDLPEDTFEAFLSVPVLVRNRVMGVVNVQHRGPHTHTGNELETITTVGEQLGCLLMLAHLSAGDTDMSHHADLVLEAR
jgi:signal transduction protein with GAF and PtsI domain